MFLIIRILFYSCAESSVDFVRIIGTKSFEKKWRHSPRRYKGSHKRQKEEVIVGGLNQSLVI